MVDGFFLCATKNNFHLFKLINIILQYVYTLFGHSVYSKGVAYISWWQERGRAQSNAMTNQKGIFCTHFLT